MCCLPPIGNKPGALQAETPLFLDFLIGARQPPASRYTPAALNWLDAESQRRYRKAFPKLNDGEADAILKPWLRTWMSDHPPTESHADFINIAHEDIRTATMNSKAWNECHQLTRRRQLRGCTGIPLNRIHGTNSACLRVPIHVIALRTAHTIPAYPR